MRWFGTVVAGLASAAVLAAAGCSAPPPPPPPPPAPVPVLTPPMGWNSWNSGITLTEQSVHETIDAMVSSGMRDAGYRYVDLDAGWAAPTRDAHGNLRADPQRFPHGIAALARYAHDRGMLLGIYHSPYNEYCGQDPRIGGAGHEQTDAKAFADWGVDYLKYDWCRIAADHDDQVRGFTAMRDALRATGRHIVYSINPNSSGDPGAGLRYDWSQISDVTRNTIDLFPAWGNPVMWAAGLAGVSSAFAASEPVAPRSGPTHVNDPDMLVVGIGWNQFVSSHPTMSLGPPHQDLTGAEQRAHFSLWAMLAAPLLAGNDIRTMTEETRAILTNADVIAVDQDPLMVQARPLGVDPRVLVKPLADGAKAVALYNRDATPAEVRTDTAAIGLGANVCHTVRDLWQHTDETTTGGIDRQVPGHGVTMLRVTTGCS